jgi:transposase
MRCIGLDVHRDFCEVAIAEHGRVRSAGRFSTDPASVEGWARELSTDDLVTLEATGNALAIARLIEPFARVILANPKAVKGATAVRTKTDKIDARTLATLLAGGFLPEVWIVDEATRVLRRRVSRRAHLVKARTKVKNQVHATLIRNLKRVPVSDLFGVRGLAWLAELELPADERETVDACLRHIAFLDREIGELEMQLAAAVLASPPMRRLLTLPGVNSVSAAAFMAAVGDISRFPTAGHLVSYLGLNPRVHQSGSEKARHGRITKQGPSDARHVLVEAAWRAARETGPLRAFSQRVAARRGPNIATVAVARKLVVIAWHMLGRDEEYAFVRPSLVREKLRRLELLTGAERHRGKRSGVFATRTQHRLEKELASRAEVAYQRLVQDWSPSRKAVRVPQAGRASHDAERPPARQGSAPDPALRFGDHPHR